MAVIHGRNFVLETGGNVIGAAKSCEVEVSCDTIETASATSATARTYIPGRTSWTASCECLFTDNYPTNNRVMNVGNTVTARFGIGGTSISGNIMRGSAIVTRVRFSGAWGNLAKYSVTLQGTGALSSTT